MNLIGIIASGISGHLAPPPTIADFSQYTSPRHFCISLELQDFGTKYSQIQQRYQQVILAHQTA
jgi:hypothetical protein